MIRLLLACTLLAVVAGPPAIASADVKILQIKEARQHTGTRHGQHHYRRTRQKIVAVGIPRCRLIARVSHGVHWRSLTCPRIAWAGTVSRQPWSYGVFRHKAGWEQRTWLWQSRIAPGPTRPTIHWGY